MNKKQQGFSFLVPIVLLTAALLAGILWYVYQTNDKASVATSNAPAKTTTTTTSPDESAKAFAKQFILAMQQGNKTEVNSYTSPALVDLIRQKSSSDNYFDGCMNSADGNCWDSYKTFDLANATYVSNGGSAYGMVVVVGSTATQGGKLVSLEFDFKLSLNDGKWLVDDITSVSAGDI